MPQNYVSKLAREHGVSTSKAEGHWSKAKAIAEKEGKGENYGYITAIFKKMMHESAYVPSLKDITKGMTFKYFLVAEADEQMTPAKERSQAWKHLQKFPQFDELPFKARRELEKEASELVDDFDQLPPEEQESVDDHLHDMVIDKMSEIHGKGVNVGDWSSTDHSDDATDDELAAEEQPQRRKEREPRRKMSTIDPKEFEMPSEDDEKPDEDDDSVLPSVGDVKKKSYFKPWANLSDEQRSARAAVGKKHSLALRIKNAQWFQKLDPETQSKIITAIKSGSAASAEAARGLLNQGPVTESTILKLYEVMGMKKKSKMKKQSRQQMREAMEMAVRKKMKKKSKSSC